MAIVDKSLGERGHRKTALTAVFPPKQVVCDYVSAVCTYVTRFARRGLIRAPLQYTDFATTR